VFTYLLTYLPECSCLGIVVVAVGLTVGACLIVAVLVVVVRWRRRIQQDSPAAGRTETQQEMEWDNSALNITINPLDVEVLLCNINYALA